MMWRHFLIVSISVFVFTQALAAPFTVSKSEEAWLNTHPEITVGLLKNSPPISSLNAEGVLEGVDPEIIKLLNERLFGHLKIVTGTWSELYTSGLERRIDALMSLTPSEERRAYFNFTRPYISDPHIIVSGEEGQHFGNLATLAGHTISLEKNSFLASYLSEHYPEIKIRQYASTFEAIKGVEKKEVQAYIGGKLLAKHLIQSNGIKTLDIHGQSDETSETNVIAIRKDWPELGSLLDRALASIAPKELSRVTDHWGLLRPLGVASNNLVLTEEEVIWIQSHPHIVAGAESDWPPYDYVANGKAVGFGNGYLRLLAAKAGLNIEFVHGFTWQELLTKAKNKEIDILPALEKKPEREEFLNFTKPYLGNDNCLIVHRNSVGLTSLDDFSGKTLVRIKGYANTKLIVDKYPEIKIVYVDSPLDALMAVSEGRADGYVDFLGVVNYLRREYLIQNLQVATLDAIPSITSTISVGIRKDWSVLNNILEKAMAAVSSDEYENLKTQWLATEDMTQQGFKITSVEKEWLAGLGPLRVGVADSWTPITFPGIDATHQGIASEYLKIIAKKLGLEIVTTVAPWGELVDQIRAGTVDLLPAINETGARREFLAFTTPYLTIPSIIATQSDAPFYAHINDLADATVGVGEKFAIQRKLQNDYPYIKNIGYRNLEETLRSLDAGKVDAIMANSAVFAYYQNKLGLKNSIHINNTTPYEDVLAVGVRHELAPLVPIINRVLAGIGPEEHDLIMSKWSNLQVHRETDWSMALRVGLISVVVLLLILYSNRKMAKEIKKRKETEEELQHSNLLLESSIESPKGMIILSLDREYRYLTFNKSHSEIMKFAYGTEPKLGECIFDHMKGKEDIEKSKTNYSRALAGEGHLEIEEYGEPPSRSYFEVRYNPIYDANEEILGVTAFAQDITERKVAELQLIKQQQILDAMGSLALVGGWAIDVATNKLTWTRETYRIYEVNEDFTLTIENVIDYFTPDSQVLIQAAVEHSLATGEPYDLELKMITAKGNLRSVHTVGTANIEEGKVTRLFGSFQDITAIRKKDQELLEASAFREKIISESPIATAVYDPDTGKCIATNKAMAEFLGSSLEAVLATNFYELESWKKSGLLNEVEESLRDNTTRNFEVNLITSIGGKEISADCCFAPFVVGGKRFLLFAMHDISGLKKAEEEKLNLERQVQHAQKLESLGVLAGGIAHDFNNILMGVLGNAELSLYELPSESPVRDNLRGIVKASMRAADLAKQMLAYSGKGRFVIELISVNRMVEEMTQILKSSISKKVLLNFNFAQDIPAIEADITQVRQIFMNLITNASEAIDEKSGMITISTGTMEVTGDYLEGGFVNSDVAEGTYTFVEVSDTGCGMDKETQARMFDPFFSTKFTGRGLGMAATLGIIRGHSGAINVYSETDKGTTIKVLFPSSKEEAAQLRQSTPGTARLEQWLGEGTILVVDDEESVRSIAEKTLTKKGFTVLTAEDGLEGVKVFSENPEGITLVLLDITMPIMGGEEAFSEMRKIRSDVQVLLSSGYNEKDATSHFAGKGVKGFIQKPYRPSELVQKIYTLLGYEVTA